MYDPKPNPRDPGLKKYFVFKNGQYGIGGVGYWFVHSGDTGDYQIWKHYFFK